MGTNRQFDKNSSSKTYTHNNKNLKMKFSALIAVAFANDNVADDEWVGPLANSTGIARSGGSRGASDSGERRYDDLEAIASKYWRKQGLTGRDKFDERKYWTYGCHCLMLGDRPMSDMGRGAPVDGLDNKCKAYKDCQKCVREKHGDQCIGEFVRYTWRYATKRSAFESRNAPGSCERELFECDLQFVKDTFAQKDVFNQDYHLFWSVPGWDNRDPNNCVVNGGGSVEHECCGGTDQPWYWINLNRQQCCP